MGFMPNIKKAKKIGFVPDYGSDAFSVGLGSEHSGQGVSSSSTDIKGSSPEPKALGFSVVTIPAYLEHSSFVPLEVSVLGTFLEMSSATDILFPSLEVVGGFLVANPFFFVVAKGGGLFAPTSLEDPVDAEATIVSLMAATLFSFIFWGFAGPMIKYGSLSAGCFSGSFSLGFILQ
jgi:hypothetical protein